jgi:NAD(P)-dependent dehydrogenase (short-subunit alcohol dehydrogenase family)
MEPGIAWITGGGTGIGRELALALARRGWRVAISGRRPAPLAETVAALGPAPGRIEAYPADVTDAARLEATVAAIETAWGPLDLVVANAAAWQASSARRFDLAAARLQVDVNLGGLFNTLAPVVPRFVARGRGQLVLMASVAGYFGLPRSGAYGATKAAALHLAESLRYELAPHGVVVQVVCPGFVDTPLTAVNRFPMPGLMSAPAAAERIVAGLAGDRFEIAFPRRLVWPMKLLRLLPGGWRRALLGRLLRPRPTASAPAAP